MSRPVKKIIAVIFLLFAFLHGGYWLLGKLVAPPAPDPEFDLLIEERMRDRRIEWGIEPAPEPQGPVDEESVG